MRKRIKESDSVILLYNMETISDEIFVTILNIVREIIIIHIIQLDLKQKANVLFF